MTIYSATRSVHKTLTAGAPDTVNLTNPAWTWVEVINHHTTARIYFTVDGSAPTVGGDNTFVVPPYSSATAQDVSLVTNSVVRLISDTACPYSVAGQGSQG